MTEPAPQVESTDGLPIEPVLVPPKGLVPTVLALLLATAFAAVWWAPSLRPIGQGMQQPSLKLDFWKQAVDLEQMRARDDGLLRLRTTRLSQPGSLAAANEILSQFRAYLHEEASLGAEVLAQQPAARQALGDIEERVRALVATQGQDALRALAVDYGRQVRQAVEAALVQARGQHQTLAVWLREAKTPQAKALGDVAGGLGATLGGTGLEAFLHGGRLDPAAGQVVEALAQQRILQLGQRVPTGPPPLPSDAQLLLLRYRIEAHEGLSIERKLSLVQELAAVDAAAPTDYLLAVLLARAGHCREAIPAFQRAAARGQAADLAKANARWCAAQVPSE